MWRFAVMLLTVMMLCLMAPMAVMAGGMGGAPVLAITMEHWSGIVTAKARVGPGDEPGSHEGTFISIKTTLIDSGAGTVYDVTAKKDMILMRSRVTTIRAGGAAILRSGKPGLSPANSIVI